MREHARSERIVRATREHNLTDTDYYLLGCGLAIAFAKMAADELDTLESSRRRIAEYHAYAGVSAARTAIDAAANWLKSEFNIQSKPSLVDFAKKDSKFVKDLKGGVPEGIVPCLERLGEFAEEIDKQRQRAQHREGLKLVFYVPGGWHLIPVPGTPDQGEHCATLLREWASAIEEQVCRIIDALQKSSTV